MHSLDIVLTLVFSSVVLVAMIFPAMKITDWIYNTIQLSEKYYNPIMFTTLISLALCIGVFLRFA